MKLRNLFKRQKIIHSDNTEILIRHVEFNFYATAMSKYCWDGDAFSSDFLLSFSAFIPHGERFVIDTIRACRDDIKDPALKVRVAGLIEQEAMHSKAHEEFNAVYQEKGIDLRRIDQLGEWFFKRHLSAILPRSGQLAVTCAIEHFTALMAERSFSEQALMGKLDVGAREFLTWNLVEEMEHKSVAFDVYQELVGSYWIRAAMQLISLYTSGIFAYSMQSIMRTPGFRQSLPKMVDGFRFWFGLQGYFSKMQPEILAYIERTVNKMNLLRYINMQTELLEAGWNKSNRRWIVETNKGRVSSKFIIFAAGPITEPSIPDFPGAKSFSGECFHSARWNHDYDLKGKNVAVVGTGASAIQFIPEIQRQVKNLYVFQRTAPWVFPKPNREISNVEKWLNKRTSVLQNMERLSVEKIMLVVNYGLLHPWIMRACEPAAKAILRRSIPDRKLRQHVTPDFTIGCKRVLFSNSYYPAL